MKNQLKKISVLAGVVACIFFFNHCMNQAVNKNDPRGNEYAGSAACRKCHAAIYDQYITTAHNTTSSIASAESIKGNFSPDSNTFIFRPDLKVVMEKEENTFYQVAYVNDAVKKKVRFDIVTGSGRKGQSYLYWRNDKIYQMPISYNVAARKWVNSPNFPPSNVQFTRNIPIGCFQCHSSYIEKTSTEIKDKFIIDHFDKEKIIYGIDCERCHGPGTNHIKLHETNNLSLKENDLTAVSSINRQQKIFMCAVCHSGVQSSLSTTFKYNPGKSENQLVHLELSSDDISEIDVHGKQYQLLTASKCFRISKTLTCTTCHNPHVNERNDLTAFSIRCQNCHATVTHHSNDVLKLSSNVIASNCIDCHMPLKPSKIITMESKGNEKAISAMVRSHYIAVYKTN